MVLLTFLLIISKQINNNLVLTFQYIDDSVISIDSIFFNEEKKKLNKIKLK